MTTLLKRAFSISQNTLLLQKTTLPLLCTRVVFATAPSRMFIHTTGAIKEEKIDIRREEIPATPAFSPIELLREKAWKIERQAALRSRCNWTKEEDQKLLDLIAAHGKRWTMLSSHFVDRSPSNVMNRYRLLMDSSTRGPWAKEELKALEKAGQGKAFHEIQDWKAIQSQLPRQRPTYMIKQTYKHSIDPNIKHGKWSEEEIEKLTSLIHRYGEKNMQQVALMMGSRTARQCLERWRWQMTNEKKGRFSKEEGDQILDAVSKYGENFAVVAKVTGISRTPRHISQHYHNVLAPDIDKSEWTLDEEEKVYKACMKHGRDMIKAKEDLGSKRSKRDMWNHFNRYERLYVKNKAAAPSEKSQ
ncbi:uncharacterized protein ATC70_008935 [Mucor velutinosus]|uniref:Uncharacterized protein n=1 Tax=Mucor velutinosus TaxID=708070 RepID=A0AAN7DL38_9FUNG|nr:hypothetical protein ATC70_008935 [Mucor velutinosus]